MSGRHAEAGGSSLLRAALRACRRHVVFVVMFSAALNLLYLAPSLYMLQVYDRVLASGGILTLFYLSAVLVASLAVLAFLDAMRVRLLGAMAMRLDRLVAPAVLMAALDRDGRAAAGQAQPLREFDALRSAMTGPPALAAVDAPWTPIYILVCFVIHPAIGSLALFGGLLLIAIAFINQTRMHAALRDNEQAAGAMYSQQMSDAVHSETARALGMQEALVRRQMNTREAMTRASHSAGRSSATYSSGTKFVRLLLQSGSLGLGAWLAIDQQISAGAIIAASILTARAFAPLELIVGAWRQFEQGRQAYAILINVLKTQEAKRDYTILPAPRAHLSVENVWVRAQGGERVLLANANLKVEPGTIVGVVGPSGAGKTTLMRVISGALAPDQGAVRLDGAKLSDWPPAALGRHVGYLPQDVALFAGKIGDNIARFDRTPEVDGDIVSAAKAAGVHDLILSLPKGYDSEIGAGGRGLSAGQAQRIALARALYRNPVLLVLDEPNAHLDQEGEAALISALTAAKARGATAFVVAHRSTLAGMCDTLLVVRDGRLEAYGPRDQVMAKLAGGAPRPVVVASADGETGRRP